MGSPVDLPLGVAAAFRGRGSHQGLGERQRKWRLELPTHERTEGRKAERGPGNKHSGEGRASLNGRQPVAVGETRHEEGQSPRDPATDAVEPGHRDCEQIPPSPSPASSPDSSGASQVAAAIVSGDSGRNALRKVERCTEASCGRRPEEGALLALRLRGFRGPAPPDRLELGQCAWAVLHTSAAAFPMQPTAEQRTRMTSWLRSFFGLYPCGECRAHFAPYAEPCTVDHPQRQDVRCVLRTEVSTSGEYAHQDAPRALEAHMFHSSLVPPFAVDCHGIYSYFYSYTYKNMYIHVTLLRGAAKHIIENATAGAPCICTVNNTALPRGYKQAAMGAEGGHVLQSYGIRRTRFGVQMPNLTAIEDAIFKEAS
ncbi:uncharacterized protein LOC113146645 [Cyclospora cayetanensis]|uniref:Sulfhydryl oxidase n=1 Tax=Cyclospora cayetanensis TaxID=88456 RepID=A0A6P6RTJ8_9EIME|nr:uncharacterized protein LOC113146645 [Cyclospora cayetanensis]